MSVPHHVAIIPDGNRRWARKRGLPTFEGHRRGFDALVGISREARKLGIKILTIWGFSTDNWKRSKKEVGYLMKLYVRMIDQFLPEAKEDGVKIIHLGRKDRLPVGLRKKMEQAETETAVNRRHILNIALDYGGRDEILRAINYWLRKGKTKLTEKRLSQLLDTAGQADPDLIIRTSGEQRISGFLIWQAAYSEFCFTKKHMPAFKRREFRQAIKEYSQRQRRFGK